MLNLISSAPLPEILEGNWRGETVIFGHVVHFVLNITAKNGLVAALDCIEPGFMNIPVSKIACKGNSVYLDIAAADAVFSGQYDHGIGAISGSLLHGTFATALTFVRCAADPDVCCKNRHELLSCAT
jgi:hypothetical protein